MKIKETDDSSDVHEYVPVPDDVAATIGYPDNDSTYWWRRGVTDAYRVADAIVDIAYGLIIDDVDTFHALRREGIEISGVPSLMFEVLTSVKGMGVRRVARLCRAFERHGIDPVWRSDMLSSRPYLREYRRVCAIEDGMCRGDDW